MKYYRRSVLPEILVALCSYSSENLRKLKKGVAGVAASAWKIGGAAAAEIRM